MVLGRQKVLLKRGKIIFHLMDAHSSTNAQPTMELFT